MALIPIRIDRTSKPPLGTPLRSDGHWSVQGLEAVPINEGDGATLWASSGAKGAVSGGANFTPDGLRTNGLTGKADFGSNILPLLASEPWAVYIRCFVDTVITPSVYPTAIDIATGSGQPFGIGFSAATSYLGLIVGISGLATGQTDIPASNYQSKWLDIIIAYNGGGFGALTSYSLSVNGRSTPLTAAGAFAAVPNATYLGGITGEDYNRFAGVVSTFSIWRGRTLSPQQISTLLANKWQVYEPETVWIEVGGGGEAALFAGSIYGQSSASALLTSAIRMAASAQGYGASTAALNTTIALAAEILAASSASGALSTAIKLGGALSGGASTTTAALTNAITMAAQAAGLGSIGGQLAGTVAAALFAGTISGSSSASANLSTAVVLAAAAQGSAAAQAALSTALELAAQVNGIGSAVGTLGSDISGLAGSLSGSSEAQATLSTAIHLMGLADGQCGVAGRLAEPVEILAQLRVMAADPLALTISVRDPLALRVTVQ